MNKDSGKKEDERTGKNENLIQSFNNAVHGLLSAVNVEKNMKIHIIAAIFIIALSLFFDFSRVEMAMLTITITMVFMAELFNTAIEEVTDLASGGKYSKLAKNAKDIAAGGVFIAAINAVLVGYLLFYNRILDLSKTTYKKIWANSSHLSFITIGLVLVLTLLLKGLFYKGRGTPFQGGTVSGHSALAFSLATIGSFLTADARLRFMFYVLAIIVAESRLEARIHSLSEVVLGAILGVMVTLVIFMKFI